jgi:hypothetical protein
VIPMFLGENDRFVWVTLNLPVFNNSKGNFQYPKRPSLQGISISRSKTTCKRVDLGKGQAGSTVFAIDFTAKIFTAKLLPLT